ncbi:hypothetical protein BOX15_Mlig017297g1 [Macrostomum lignano]|uniref:Uncharacterized protein n=1 Tax=Macrostomum lignano TaxID=282301 RepID=A0A267FQQ8_9PLAT|nr:hypothetical protein BOX15_Mlig017297g1 [Macrostomum lignano]
MGLTLTKETAQQLLQHSQEILDSFRSADMAVDAHANQYFDGVLPRDDPVRVTIVEIFAGCIRYEKALDTVITAFYNVEGRVVKRSEQNLYRVFAYLIVFRMEELGIPNLKKLIATLERKRIYRFLSFLLNRKHLYTWMLDEWAKLYDRVYVENEIISPLEEFLPQLEEILERLRVQIEEGLKSKKELIKPTEPQPFTLTEPKPRSVPMPEELPTLAPSRPVPSSTYERPQESADLAERRRKNREVAEQRLAEATRQRPRCADPGKSEKCERKIREIRAEQERALAFDAPKSNPMPKERQGAGQAAVKLNAAAIMREWARYREAEKREAERLGALEAGAFDKSAFEAWQQAQKEADLQSQLAELERRRLEGQLSYEEAVIARRRLAESNRAVVEKEREAAAERQEELAAMRAAEEEQLKQRMAEIMAGHAKARQAVRDAQKAKALSRAEQQQETEELLKQAYEEAAAELRRKMELIAEIRAIEATQAPREKRLDLTEIAGFGFLSEMSIAELRERLSLAKQRQTQEVEEKRDQILEEKQAKDEKLLHTMELIGRHRAERSRAAAARQEEKKKRAENSRPGQPEIRARDPRLSDLAQQVQARKQERQEMQQQERQGSNLALKTTKAMSREKKAREAARWAQLESAQERVARLRTSGIVSADPTAPDERFPRQSSRMTCT